MLANVKNKCILILCGYQNLAVSVSVNLFILHNLFDDQEDEINKNVFFFTFRHAVFYEIFLPNSFNKFKSWYQNSCIRPYSQNILDILIICLKGALSGLRQFMPTESPSKIMKNAFYFTSKALSVLKIFTFSSWLFCHVSKQLDKTMTSQPD